MISSFGILHSLYLRSLSISVVWLSVHCVNHWSWFEAKECCQSIGQSLGTPNKSEHSSWSFYYTRRSHWIAALGCASSLDGKTYKKFSMQIPSAGLCQELCVEELVNITVFIVQNKTCICSTDYPVDLNLNISHCKFDCMNDMNSTHSYLNNSCQENTRPKAYSVFLSQSIREEDGAPLNATCVPVYCNKTMSSINDQLQLQNCKNVCLEKGKNFEKKRFESYCTDINLLLNRTNSATTTTQHLKTNPLVFRRQTYISHDRVSHDRKNETFSDFEKTNIILSCQLCVNGGCRFTDCNEKTSHIVCSEGLCPFNFTSVSTHTKTDKRMMKTTATAANSKSLELSSLLSTTVIQTPNATTHTPGSFSQERPSTQPFDEAAKESETMKGYGIMATSLLICIILIGVFIFIIRKKRTVINRKGPITLKDTTELTSNRKEKKRSGGVSVANSPKTRLYSFADNSKLVEQTQY